MKKLVLILAASLLLLGSAAFAADNAVVVTPGSGVTMKSKDVGSGVQSMQPILSDSSGNPLVGQQPQASSIPVVLPSDPDSRPATGTITVQDTGSSTASGQSSVSIVTGTATASSFNSQAINGTSNGRIQISGTWTGTIVFEGSIDSGTTWVAIPARVVGTVYTLSSVTANGMFDVDTSGLTSVRARATAAVTGTATIRWVFTSAPGTTQILNPIRIVDNASGAQAAVKAASTAAATTDTALVVGLSPNGCGASGGNVAVPVAPTIQAAAYASGNAVGALQSVSVFRTAGCPSGIMNSMLLAWKGTETVALTFYVFDTNPSGSTCTDKTAFSLAAADVPKLALQPFTLTAAAPSVGTTTTYATSSFSPTSVKNQDGSPTTNVYICTVSGGTFTPAVGDLNYKPALALD